MTVSKQSQDGTALKFYPDSPWKRISHLHETYQCRIYGRKPLMMGRGDARNCSSILTLLGSSHQNLHETYQCRMYIRELLMMGREDARNM